MTQPLNERILPDDYPVYAGYLYVVDGTVITADYTMTVKRLKMHHNASTVTDCDIKGRNLWDRMV